jgi:alkylhydroperoxidase family enzyme
MAWIRVIRPGQAEGLLKQLYNAAVKRAGKVYNIISIQSLRPKVLRSSTTCGLSRAQREMIATTVSAVNDCHY